MGGTLNLRPAVVGPLKWGGEARVGTYTSIYYMHMLSRAVSNIVVRHVYVSTTVSLLQKFGISSIYIIMRTKSYYSHGGKRVAPRERWKSVRGYVVFAICVLFILFYYVIMYLRVVVGTYLYCILYNERDDYICGTTNAIKRKLM